MTMPERRCLLSRESLPTEQMVRFVVGPADLVVPDLRAQLPGRGMWVTATRDAVEQVRAKGLFSKGAKRKVKAPDDLADLVGRLLEDRVQELMSLARRAGQLASGFDTCRDALKGKRAPALYLHASDAAEDGREKLGRIAAARDIPTLAGLSAERQGRIWGGGAPIMHQVVMPGGLSRQLVAELARLQGWRD